MGKVFSNRVRQAAFEAAAKALRVMFPTANEHFVRKQAQATARMVPIEKKARPKTSHELKVARAKAVTTRRARVAHTYRAQTRAERQQAHRDKMLFNSEHRAGWTSRAKPLANLSRNHPDYGCTPAEHARRKAGRA